MIGFVKSIKILFLGIVFISLSACSLGQTTVSTPPVTATNIDVFSVMTSAAATAFVELTQIAGNASETVAPTNTLTPEPPTDIPDIQASTPTTDPSGLVSPTSTETAGGLPIVETSVPDVGGVATSTLSPSLTPLVPVATTVPSVTCYKSKFIEDVTIPDGTVMKKSEKFRKVWRIQNTGTCKWDQGFGLTVWIDPGLGGAPIYFSNNDQAVKPGGIVDLGIDMIAPSVAGDYVGHWMMISDQGFTFGEDFTVFIKVTK